MTSDSKAVCGGGEGQAARWLPIETAPTDRPVVVRMRTDRLSGGWFVATVTLPDPEDESRFAGSSTIWHYNGDILMSRFRGTWTHWLCDDPAALASTAGAGAGDWQPIETAPKDGTWFLGWQQASGDFAHKPANVVRWHEGTWTLWASRDPRDPTHWMPLPASPFSAVPASPRSGAGEGGGMLSTAERQRLGQVAMEAFGDKGFGLDIGRGVFEHAVDRVVSALSQGGGAGRSEKGEGGVRQAAERLLDGYRGLEAILAGMDADIPDGARVVVRVGPRYGAHDLATYGAFRSLDHALKGLPASPPAPAEHGVEIRQAAQPLADIAAQWDDIRSGNPEAPDGTLVSVSLGELRALNRSLSQGGGAGRSEKGEGEGLERVHDAVAASARTAAEQMEWMRPRPPAPAQSPSTSDAEG